MQDEKIRPRRAKSMGGVCLPGDGERSEGLKKEMSVGVKSHSRLLNNVL